MHNNGQPPSVPPCQGGGVLAVQFFSSPAFAQAIIYFQGGGGLAVQFFSSPEKGRLGGVRRQGGVGLRDRI